MLVDRIYLLTQENPNSIWLNAWFCYVPAIEFYILKYLKDI